MYFISCFAQLTEIYINIHMLNVHHQCVCRVSCFDILLPLLFLLYSETRYDTIHATYLLTQINLTSSQINFAVDSVADLER